MLSSVCSEDLTECGHLSSGKFQSPLRSSMSLGPSKWVLSCELQWVLSCGLTGRCLTIGKCLRLAHPC